MARTIHGNYTGKAAVIARHDLQEEINEARRRFNADLTKALENLKALDPDWETWYDSRPEQTCGEMLPLMKERVELLLNEQLAALYDECLFSAGLFVPIKI